MLFTLPLLQHLFSKSSLSGFSGSGLPSYTPEKTVVVASFPRLLVWLSSCCLVLKCRPLELGVTSKSLECLVRVDDSQPREKGLGRRRDELLYQGCVP